MASTRSSPDKANSSQASAKSSPIKTGAKRKANDDSDTASPATRKRGKPSKKGMEQKTLEETMDTPDEKAEISNIASSAPKKRGRGRPSKKDKEQMTLEETMNVEVEENGKEEADQEDEAMRDVSAVEDDTVVAEQINGKSHINDDIRRKNGESKADKPSEKEESKNTESAQENEETAKNIRSESHANLKADGEKNAFDEVKADTDDVKKAAEDEQEAKTKEINDNNESVIEDAAREATIPSSILEKGIIYFFFRARVNITDPQGIEDIARSFIVLRPLPLGAKLGSGPLEDSSNARLIALPKKMLPKSGSDRFLTFVDAANSSIKDLRDHFAGNAYTTKTQGSSNTQPATPFAEGVYAITSTGRESHIAYHLTIPAPNKIGEIQHELGLAEKGSFIASVKNPKTSSPANASIDNPAIYPAAIQDKFGKLRWSPLEPNMLDYVHAQMLLIGEERGDVEKAMKEMGADKKDEEKVAPEEEMELLEKEDHDRVEHLKEDDPVFADLGLSSKEYPHLKTTW